VHAEVSRKKILQTFLVRLFADAAVFPAVVITWRHGPGRWFILIFIILATQSTPASLRQAHAAAAATRWLLCSHYTALSTVITNTTTTSVSTPVYQVNLG